MVDNNIRKYAIVAIVVIVIAALGYVFYSGGTNGLLGIVSSLMSILIWGGLVFVIVLIVYFLFFYEKRVNVSFEVFKAIKSECRINRLPNLRSLILSGDKKYSRPIQIGKIVGFSSRKTYADVTTADSKDGVKYFQNETVFLVKQNRMGVIGAIAGFFAQPAVIRTPSDLHTDLHGDVIVKANSLVKHGMYYYPDVIHLDTKAIDTTLYYEGERFMQLGFISKIEPVISRAIGVTKDDLKILKGKTGFEMLREKGDVVTGGQHQPAYYPPMGGPR